MTFPTTGNLDAFTRADSTTTIGTNWTVLTGTGDLGIKDNQAYNPDAGTYWPMVYWNPATFGPNCEAYLTDNVLGNNGDDGPAIYLGIVNPGDTFDGYDVFGGVVNTGGNEVWVIERDDDGVPTQLGATFAQNIAAGDSLGIERIGSTINAYYKAAAGAWTLLASRTDTTYAAAGRIGFYGAGNTGTIWRYDNFGGGTVVGIPVKQMMHYKRMRE